MFKLRNIALAAAFAAAPLAAHATDMPDWIKPPTYDCRTCHAIDKKVIGPAWKDVAEKYKGDPKAHAFLMEKVRKGGKGNWTAVTGGVPMVPHPKLTDAELDRAVTFVLSLAK